MDEPILGMILKLLLAAVLGGLIGLEREAHGRPAGLRTHILVSLGAALFTVISNTYRDPGSDPGRIASQIVSGIGFLGAGTIIRQGSIVRGLTTAASLWTTAAIGMAAGAGGNLMYLAVVAAVIVFITLGLINRFEQAMSSRQNIRDIFIGLSSGRGELPTVLEAVSGFGISILGISTEEDESGVFTTRLRLRLPSGVSMPAVAAELSSLSEVRSVNWE